MASSEWLLDSNILIDVLKGEAKALAWLDAHGAEAAISVITWIEVLVGCSEQKAERETVQRWLDGFQRIDLDGAIAARAVLLRRERRLKVPDAIILATAQCQRRRLVSRNIKDFPPTLEGVVVPYTLGDEPKADPSSSDRAASQR
ncbi:type II toxin-antitoxin system VapC family toxin [Synechococcus sp. GreenBA-s]|nr:type II toxin-antitoxin system VapC family toxin [Synechococcus sp. GreenBA-s]